MKILVAILSCAEQANQGYHQAIRDTWLQDAKIDYKFFIGSNHGEEFTPDVENTWRQDTGTETYSLVRDDNKQILKNQEPDEVILSAYDDYKHLPFKTKELCKYALEKEYDYIYKCDSDTYARPERLLSSGFEKYNYSGALNKWTSSNFRETKCECPDCLKKYPKRLTTIFYANGGPGYCISSKCAKILAQEPVVHWAEDIWVGLSLWRNGITLQEDSRYSPRLSATRVLRSNNNISQHLSEGPGTYQKSFMYIAEGHWQRSH